MSSNPGKSVPIYQFSELFAKAWRQAMTPSNIVSGFRVTGAYPAQPAGTPTSCLAKKKGIHYMPFYSPSCEQKKSEETIRKKIRSINLVTKRVMTWTLMHVTISGLP